MKNCPNCNDFALYDDEITKCPLCGTTLVKYYHTSHRTIDDVKTVVSPIISNTDTGRSDVDNTQTVSVPSFETQNGLRYVYRGTVTEINSHTRYHNRLKKIVNAIFRGEPYQFGNSSHETVFRIEEFHRGRLSGKKRDLIFYGDIEGRLNYGDDIRAVVKKRGGRYVATSLYSNETESQIKPTPQIPSWIFTVLALCLFVAICYFIGSGMAATFFTKVIIYAILIIAFLIFIKNFFGD